MWWAAKKTPVATRYRAPLMFAMSLWTVGWTGFAYSLLHVFSGVAVPHPIAVVGDAIFAVFVTNYVLGLWSASRCAKVGRRPNGSGSSCFRQ